MFVFEKRFFSLFHFFRKCFEFSPSSPKKKVEHFKEMFEAVEVVFSGMWLSCAMCSAAGVVCGTWHRKAQEV